MASVFSTKPNRMANQDKKDKNVKKAATKPAKIAGQPVVPKYARSESVTLPAALPYQGKKGQK